MSYFVPGMPGVFATKAGALAAAEGKSTPPAVSTSRPNAKAKTEKKEG